MNQTFDSELKHMSLFHLTPKIQSMIIKEKLPTLLMHDNSMEFLQIIGKYFEI